MGSGSVRLGIKLSVQKSSEESRRTEINATVQISTFNETKPWDIIFKITPNNHSQFGIMSMNDSNSMSLSSSQMLGQEQQLNVTFTGIPINQTQPQSPVSRYFIHLTRQFNLMAMQHCKHYHLTKLCLMI